MPTKITPFPKVGGGGGGGGGGGKPGGAKTSTKFTASVKAPRKSTFFKASHFAAATGSLSVVTQNKGYLHAIIFAACVGLGLLVLGAVLVHIGDDDYIVDLMVLGGLFIVMGVGSLVLGCGFTLRPVCKEHELRKTTGRSVRSALPPENNTPDSYINPAFLMVEMSQPAAALDSSVSDSVSNNLYDRESLGAKGSVGGRLVPPSPPPVTQPSTDGQGTASMILTTLVAESDEVSEVSNEASVVR